MRRMHQRFAPKKPGDLKEHLAGAKLLSYAPPGSLLSCRLAGPTFGIALPGNIQPVTDKSTPREGRDLSSDQGETLSPAELRCERPRSIGFCGAR